MYFNFLGKEVLALIAQRIREERQLHGLSQERLGQILGVTQQAVAKWENAKAEPDSSALLKMSTLFNVSVDYLLGNDAHAPERPVYDSRISQLPSDKKRILDTVLNELERTDKQQSATGG